jgi:hypothetical protein
VDGGGGGAVVVNWIKPGIFKQTWIVRQVKMLHSHQDKFVPPLLTSLFSKVSSGGSGARLAQSLTINCGENSWIFLDAADQTLPVTEYSEIDNLI